MLNAVFEKCPRPTREIKEQIGLRLGLSVRCIQIWFQNRRAKARKEGGQAGTAVDNSPRSERMDGEAMSFSPKMLFSPQLDIFGCNGEDKEIQKSMDLDYFADPEILSAFEAFTAMASPNTTPIDGVPSGGELSSAASDTSVTSMHSAFESLLPSL
jgi:hypothetical protein